MLKSIRSDWLRSSNNSQTDKISLRGCPVCLLAMLSTSGYLPLVPHFWQRDDIAGISCLELGAGAGLVFEEREPFEASAQQHVRKTAFLLESA